MKKAAPGADAPRPYRMVTRAKAAEETGRRIVEAAYAAFKERAYDDITLGDIAQGAGVTLQTVLRRFGSKEQLFQAAGEVKAREIMRRREPAAPGDTEAALAALLANYEEIGDMSWRALSEADRLPVIAELMASARTHHRAWITRCFAHLLPPAPAPERERRIDLLFAATDFYVWKLLRRDLGRSPAEVLARMRDTVGALEAAFATWPASGPRH